jgi:hypothetical protein
MAARAKQANPSEQGNLDKPGVSLPMTPGLSDCLAG